MEATIQPPKGATPVQGTTIVQPPKGATLVLPENRPGYGDTLGQNLTDISSYMGSGDTLTATTEPSNPADIAIEETLNTEGLSLQERAKQAANKAWIEQGLSPLEKSKFEQEFIRKEKANLARKANTGIGFGELSQDKNLGTKVKEFFAGEGDVTDRYGSKSRLEIFKDVAGAPGQMTKVVYRYVKGRLLGTPEIGWAVVKKALGDNVPDAVKGMTLDQAMDWAAGENPTGFQQAVGGLAEFAGGAKTGSQIVGGVLGEAPKAIGVAGKALIAGESLGIAAGGKELSKAAAETIDPNADYGYRGAPAVAEDFVIGAIFSLAGSAVKGIFSKLKPTEQTKALKTLGLGKNASEAEVKQAARKYALKYHPDKVKGMRAEFEKVMHARETLLKPDNAKDIIYRGQGKAGRTIQRSNMLPGQTTTAITPERSVPEPTTQLQAQVKDMLNPKTARDAVFADKDAVLPAIPANAINVDSEIGTLITTNQAKAEAFKRSPDNATIAKILDYAENKTDIIESGKPAVVTVAKDSEGSIIKEELTTKPAETVEKLKKEGYIDVSVERPEQVIENRNKAVETERNQPDPVSQPLNATETPTEGAVTPKAEKKPLESKPEAKKEFQPSYRRPAIQRWGDSGNLKTLEKVLDKAYEIAGRLKQSVFVQKVGDKFKTFKNKPKGDVVEIVPETTEKPHTSTTQKEKQGVTEKPIESPQKAEESVVALEKQGYTTKQAELIVRNREGMLDVKSPGIQKVLDNPQDYTPIEGSGNITVFRVSEKGKGLAAGQFVFTSKDNAIAFRDEFGFERGQPDIIEKVVDKADLRNTKDNDPSELIFFPQPTAKPTSTDAGKGIENLNRKELQALAKEKGLNASRSNKDLAQNIQAETPSELTEDEFFDRYSQHIDLRGRKSGKAKGTSQQVLKEGFTKSNISFGNTLPAYRGGEPTDVIQKRYAPAKGDIVYLVPKDQIDSKGNIKEGWKPKPSEVVEIQYDNQSLYEASQSSFNHPAPKDRGQSAQGVTEEVISEESYLATHGAGRQLIGEAALHKNIQEGRAKRAALKHMSEKDDALIKKREELRREYRAKVESGEIRPPTRIEELMKIARGMPELKAVQAARRLLEKRGVDWQSAQGVTEEGVNKKVLEQAQKAIKSGRGGKLKKSLLKSSIENYENGTGSIEDIKLRLERFNQEADKMSEDIKQESKAEHDRLSAIYDTPKKINDRISSINKELAKQKDTSGVAFGGQYDARGQLIQEKIKLETLLESQSPTPAQGVTEEGKKQVTTPKAEEAVVEGAVKVEETIYGGGSIGLSIKKDGKLIADMTFSIDKDGNAKIGFLKAMKGRGTLSIADLREAQRQAKEKFPEIKKFVGDRVTKEALTQPTAKPTEAVEPTPAQGVTEEAKPIPEKVKNETILNNVEIKEVPVHKLHLSKEVLNFKEDADPKTGIVRSERLSGEYNRLGTAPIIVWERSNGVLEVITGRHRLDLARQNKEKTIPAQIVKESEGFDRAMALTIDAESNIRDGQGKVKDYAQYFKNTEISEQEAKQRGLLARAKGQTGFVIGKSAVDDVYARFIAGKISERKAAAIAKGAPNNESAQLAALSKMNKMSVEELQQYSSILNRTKPSDNIKPTQGNLFGFDDTALIEAEKVAKEVTKEGRSIKDRILAVKGALKRPETARQMGLEFTDEASIRQEVQKLEERLDELSRFATNPTLYQEMRQKAGLESKLQKTGLFREDVFTKTEQQEYKKLQSEFEQGKFEMESAKGKRLIELDSKLGEQAAFAQGGEATLADVKTKESGDLLGQANRTTKGGVSGNQENLFDKSKYKTFEEAERINAENDVQGQKRIDKPKGGGGSAIGDPTLGAPNEIDRGRIKVSMEQSNKPQSAREVIDYIGRAFNIPIRGKATFNKKALGWFDPKAVGIRIKDVASLTTTMHEIGHHIDYTLNNKMSKTPPSPAIKKELLKLGKNLYGNKTPSGGYKSEGFAEYIRKYLTEDAPDSVPALHKWFTETYLPAHKDMAKNLSKAKKMIDKWRLQGAESRIDSQISKKKIKGTAIERIEKGLLWTDTMFRDELAPIRQAMKKAGIKPDELNPSQDPYQIAVGRADKAGAIAQNFVLEYTTDTAGNKTGKGLREILKPVSKDMDNFTRWIVSARARLLQSKGINPGISKMDADYVYEKYDNSQWQNVLKELTDWNHRVLDYLVEAGGMSKESANLIKKSNPIYIPFMRAFKEGEIVGKAGAGRGVAKTSNAVKKIKGSGREIIDPIESMLKQTERIISIAHKAEVAKALANLANKEGTASMIWEVPAPKQSTRFEAEQLKKDIAKIAYQRMGLDPDMISSSMLEHWDEVLTVYSNASHYYGKDNIVSLVVNGEQKFYEVDPALYKAIEGLDQYTLPWLANVVFGKPTRMVRLGATGLNASFGIIRNTIRDALTFTVLSKHAKAGPISSAKGIIKDVVNTEDAKKFKAMGGKMASQILSDRRAAQHLKKHVLKNTVGDKTIYTFAHPVDALRELFGVTEAGTRIGEFDPALKYAEKKWGKGSKDAMLYALNQAQDVTTNFSRHGKIAKVLNQCIPFFNAAIQGPDKMFRTFRARPFATTIKAVVGLTIPAIWAWWRSKDEDWYKNLAPHERANYMHFRVPGTKKIIRIPVPFELGHIFMSAPVAALDAQYRDDPEIVKEIFAEAIKQANPFDWPAVIGPAIDVMTNRDFAGRPIVSKSVENKLPEDQYGRYTTGLMKIIGRQLKVSPSKLEHLVNSYSGGVYRRVSRTIDLTKKEEITASDIPILGTLFLRESFSPRSQLDRFYKRRDLLNQNYSSKKISGKEMIERIYINRKASDLSELWAKLPEAKTAKERKAIYSEMRQLCRPVKITKDEVMAELKGNTYKADQGRKDISTWRSHKNREAYVEQMKTLYKELNKQ